MRVKEDSPLLYVLKALVPYTSANLNLAYKPNKFFNELEKLSSKNQKSLKTAYNRAVDKGLIELDNNDNPKLTEKGIRSLAPFEAKYIKGSKLLVIFDIPEADRWQRDRLRSTLREFKFKQIQRSVWVTDVDCIKYIKEELKYLKLHDEVKVFESKELL